MKNILLLTYYFPPIPSIGSNRNFNFYKVAKNKFQKVFVLTTTNANKIKYQVSLGSGKNIHLINTFDYRTIFLNKNKDSFHPISSVQKPSQVNSFLRKLINSFPINILIGEGGLLYILSAFRKAKKIIKSEDIDVIYSSFRPYSDHFISFLLKRKFPNLYWIADFRDIHIDKHRDTVLLPSFQNKLNNCLLRKADIVTTVSKGLKKSLNQIGQNVRVLKNGYANWMMEIGEVRNLETFSFGYTGSIYPVYQTLDPLVQSLKSIYKINTDFKSSFIYAGKDGEILKSWLEENNTPNTLKNRENVSQEESFSIQRSVHINVMLTWSYPGSRGILTGKLYEYVIAQNPILCIVQGSYDQELSELFENHNLGLVFYTEETNSKVLDEWILSLYKEWSETGQIKWEMNNIQALDFERNCEHFFSKYLNI